MNEIKRGPGRPPKYLSETDNFGEQIMNVEAKETTEAPKMRGVREAAVRTEELRARLRINDPDKALHDDFYIDPAEIPEGWDYNWKRKSTAGQIDEEYQVELAQDGWEPVDTARHPYMMPKGYRGAIERKGMILMERPAEISEMVRQRDIAAARQVVIDQNQALGQSTPGTFDTNNKTVRKNYGPVNIPRE
jgi:hypothetical protein